MAAPVRHHTSLPKLMTTPTRLLVALALANTAACFPAVYPTNDIDGSVAEHWKRVEPVVVTSPDGTNTTVFNPANGQVIAQGSATDGGGVDFSVPALIWLAFVFAVGAPLALVGIRLWRVTTGAGVGLAATVCVWAAFVNTVSAEGLSDLVLTVIAVGAFVVGFLIGVLNIGRLVGILLLGGLGGASFGVRIILLRPGLLIPLYVGNWLVITVFIILGLGAIVYRQRFGLVSSCAAVGTFLVGLGVDLILNKQSGMSIGLRFLFDRNSAHYLAIVHQGYHPPVVTQIILGASLGAIPVLAFAQHKIFSAPFRPKSKEPEFDTASVSEEQVALNHEKEPEKEPETRIATPATSKRSLLGSRFSTS